ncbi:tyrosine-type recombinase/integrase [Cryobacterium sp. M91]|uniref:tyrosine-type recombinase/integrase n=1 Tax=Cryobacterium sp. M91 TaxID=2048294 RepID=UPI000CE3BC28|nr:tyrosine-type recombinase/integrase [Cryobacterium sp. M91]
MTVVLLQYQEDYLRLRRLLGATLKSHEPLISQFLAWLDETGGESLTVESAVRWAVLPVDAAARWRAFRLSVIRGFAGYVHAQDPALAQIIPMGLVPSKVVHAIPYLYAPDQTLALMTAALTLSPQLRGLTLQTVIGLMATTGMRVGEIVALDLNDIDLMNALITVTGKYGKTRLLPILPSTVTALREYLRHSRELVVARDGAPFFLTFIGTRPATQSIQKAFRSVATSLNLVAQPGIPAPRLHDFRHTFATTTLLQAYRQGIDVDAQVAVLATYLGHVSPASTYWYLSASPELLTVVSERVEAAQLSKEMNS